MYVSIYGSLYALFLKYNDTSLSGAIIGDGDRKRTPFLVLGLAP